jgi:hypothetical protein
MPNSHRNCLNPPANETRRLPLKSNEVRQLLAKRIVRIMRTRQRDNVVLRDGLLLPTLD